MAEPHVMRRVIVSLHDVAPPFEDAIRMQLEMLAAIGVRRVVLKVVPNWHGAYPLQAFPRFVELLAAQTAEGSQLVLHGYEHRASGAYRGTPLRRMRARLFAGDAAEFLTLSTDEATSALEDGIACLERVGLPRPSAFCAPGWLHNTEAVAALLRVHLRYLVGMFTVRDLRTERRIWMPSVGYMGASSGQEAGVQILNSLLRSTVLPPARLVKVYLHPQHEPAGPAVRRLLAELGARIERGEWQPATYDEVCGDA